MYVTTAQTNPTWKQLLTSPSEEVFSIVQRAADENPAIALTRPAEVSWGQLGHITNHDRRMADRKDRSGAPYVDLDYSAIDGVLRVHLNELADPIVTVEPTQGFNGIVLSPHDIQWWEARVAMATEWVELIQRRRDLLVGVGQALLSRLADSNRRSRPGRSNLELVEFDPDDIRLVVRDKLMQTPWGIVALERYSVLMPWCAENAVTENATAISA